MNYQRSISDIAETLQNARERGRCCTLLIGAGCSVKAGIPVASGFVEIIREKYPRAYARAREKTYTQCMGQLLRDDRHHLIAEYVDKAKINWAHVCIALLIQKGYVDRVLTTNFDPLVVRSCAMIGEFPAVYDLAASQLLKAAYIPPKAIFYLHGQRSGFILINTQEEYEKHSKLIGPAFEDSGRGRVWIIIGYSGENDPVFEHLAKFDHFDNGLYWVGYPEKEPPEHLSERLLNPGKDAFYVSGFDADSFFVSLTQELRIFPPDLIGRPFTHLDHTMEMLTSYALPGQESQEDVTKTTRQWIQKAIEQFEKGTAAVMEQRGSGAELDKVIPASVALAAQLLLMAGEYDRVIDFNAYYTNVPTPELADALFWAYLMQGNSLYEQTKVAVSDEADRLFRLAGEKYQTALTIKPDKPEALYNWANALADQARTKTGAEADRLFTLAEEKYQAAIAIRPDKYEALNNWSNALVDQSKTKAAPEAIGLLAKAREKYHAASYNRKGPLTHLAAPNDTSPPLIEGVRQRLKASSIDPASREYARIVQVLENGDALTANEYIQMASAVPPQPLPEGGSEVMALGKFFPDMLRQIEAFMESQDYAKRFDVNRVVKDLRAYARGVQRPYRIGPVDLSEVTGGQATQVATMLEAWFSIKKNKNDSTTYLEMVLAGLGFNSPRVTRARSGRHPWFEITCQVVQSREQCPLPMYGSDARGQYRLLCIWDRPTELTEEDLLNEVGDPFHGSPVIVFHFGRLSEPRRRALARLCRERQRTFVVLDDILLIYLCGESTLRLNTFFSCSLPFTFAEPYRIAAGLVPPEMFYGREQERSSVKAPFGSCFIYGGRQMGKTALLRRVEQEFHEPKEGRIVRWIDLKSEGLGDRRPLDDFWRLLGRELKALGVLPEKVPAQNPDKLAAGIKSWLYEDKKRRILLLLDEADRFLDADGQEGFTRCSRIKGLMEATNRDFKVVFAGLHNVLRTTQQENHPLAHYGDPLCIGPLLENGEMRQARELIEHPLGSVGYAFESPDLVTRILSQTNYYPSLIQLYCAQLLKHINNSQSPRFERLHDQRSSPPCLIASQDVEEATRSQNLLRAIRDRFVWTLQLDARYEVVAYVIAYGFLEETEMEGSAVTGFPLPWIRKEALKYWPKGLAESAPDSFRVLLDEMVGLGILRSPRPDHYTLRSPNVVSLMGTRDEIESALLRTREVPTQYEAATFRAAYQRPDGEIDPARRSPLTDRQESDLRRWENGVSVIVGCEAAGILEVEKFLRAGSEKEFFVALEADASMADFERALDGLGHREKDGTTILLVPHGCNWDEAWVAAALQKTANLDRARENRVVNPRFARIVFVATPRLAWAWDERMEGWCQAGMSLVSLQPWHDAALKQWLDDTGFIIDKQDREEVAKQTGNWPLLLYCFLQASHGSKDRLQAGLKGVERLFESSRYANQLARAFGFDRPEPRPVLTDLAILDAVVSERDLAGVSSSPVDQIQRACRWADRLSLVKPAGDCWELDPAVKRVIGSVK